MSYALALSPGGHLFLETDEQALPALSAAAARRLNDVFAVSGTAGLELLASELLHEPLPPSLAFCGGN